MLGPDEEIAGAASLAPAQEEDLTDIDEEALDNLPDPEPLESLVQEEAEDEDEDLEIDPDDIPDPDPIPDVFTDVDEDDEESTPRRWWLWAAIGGGALVLILLLLFFLAPFTVASVVPGTESIYAAMGIATEDLGAGLEIRPDRPKREGEPENEMIVLTGKIVNKTDKVRQVPMLQMSLRGEERVVLRIAEFPPAKRELKPDENLDINLAVKSHPLTRTVEVTFSDTAVPAMNGTDVEKK